MKKSMILMVLISLLVILLGVQCSSPPQGEPADEGPDMTTPEGLINQKCTECHGSTVIKSTNRTEQDWIELVERMMQKGAELNEEERDIIIDYLVENYKK